MFETLSHGRGLQLGPSQDHVSGGFVFDRVAVGTHTLAVPADNLPLPWSLDPAHARRSVQVEVHDRNDIDIPALRPR